MKLIDAGGRTHLQRWSQRLIGRRRFLASMLIIVAGFVIAACSTPAAQPVEPAPQPEPTPAATAHLHTGEAAASGDAVTLPHVHGIGFSADGAELSVAAHDGLRIFTRGRWLDPEIPRHDYMGYAPVAAGFYSSGHPAPGSELRNPLGLVKSSDGGESIEHLAFEGESDFHVMAVGYYSHAIYVINPQANSQLPPGLHYSFDDGESWQQAALNRLTGQLIGIAVHPSDESVVALVTATGLFLSTNHGDDFVHIFSEGPATGVQFSPDGENLYFGYLTLARYHLDREEIEPLPAPEVAGDDGIAYIAINPMDLDEIAFATFRRHIHRSTDGGQNWQPIALDGKGVVAE
jgi:hypothetical protein